MELKRGTFYEPKRAGGINLTEELWTRVKLASKVNRLSKSSLMAAVLDEHLPSLADLRKLLPESEESEEVLAFDADPEEENK